MAKLANCLYLLLAPNTTPVTAETAKSDLNCIVSLEERYIKKRRWRVL